MVYFYLKMLIFNTHVLLFLVFYFQFLCKIDKHPNQMCDVCAVVVFFIENQYKCYITYYFSQRLWSVQYFEFSDNMFRIFFTGSACITLSVMNKFCLIEGSHGPQFQNDWFYDCNQMPAHQKQNFWLIYKFSQDQQYQNWLLRCSKKQGTLFSDNKNEYPLFWTTLF